MKKRLLAALGVLTLSFGLATPVDSRHVVSGSENTMATNRLTSQITWHRSLAQAQEDARRSGRMVFWMNMLGTLSGAT